MYTYKCVCVYVCVCLGARACVCVYDAAPASEFSHIQPLLLTHTKSHTLVGHRRPSSKFSCDPSTQPPSSATPNAVSDV